MAWVDRTIPFRRVRYGMNASLYATEVSPHQVELAVNCHLSREAVLFGRSGSVRISNTALPAKCQLLHGFNIHNSNNTITRVKLAATPTNLYKFNKTTLVWDVVAGTPTFSGLKPSMTSFLNGSGVECVVFMDGLVMFMYDGTTVTNLLPAWQAGGFTSAPRYSERYADALWCVGDYYNSSLIGVSDDLNPTIFNPTAVYPIDMGDGDQVRGLCLYYDMLAIAKDHSITLIRGKDRTTFEQKRVSNGVGAFSHWGMQSQGNLLFFNDDSNFYVGLLREFTENGMVTMQVGDNMSTRYAGKKAGSAYTMESVYIASSNELMWSVQTADANAPNEIYVLSTQHSHFQLYGYASPTPDGPDTRFVWAGVWLGIDVTALAVIEDDNATFTLYAGGADGYVRLVDDGWKDDRAVGAVTGTDIPFIVIPSELFLQSEGVSARVRRIFPVLYTKHNQAVTTEWIIDQSVRHPIDENGDPAPVVSKFTGNIPHWNDGLDPDITSKWGSTIWKDKPFLRVGVTVNEMAGTFQPIFTCSGVNVEEEFAYAGYSGLYQIKKARIRG